MELQAERERVIAHREMLLSEDSASSEGGLNDL